MTTPAPSSFTSTSLQGNAKGAVRLKIGMVGDCAIGKTSLMVKWVENKYDEGYIETLGVSFLEKTITLKNTDITFSIWDLGGAREFAHMLPIVCQEALVVFFMFDLSRKLTLQSVREWYRQVRTHNTVARPFLIGTKYDLFVRLPAEEQHEITVQARKFAAAMKATLVYCSSSHSINIQKIFKIVVSKVFDIPCQIPQTTDESEPLLEFHDVSG
eukprot:TRINITY_DN3141_c0_g1_i1.p1 TRINITY_DN3141_c0_g1~~TRINITY_DN3141_c0_g1_i1.p1  ORF type:complete len:214 (+),score=78.84 TRINITY_DN3141_c0_g1_i1:20-661(+)